MSVDRFYLVSKPGSMTELTGRMLVGRDLACNISLDHAEVSRHHAQIVVTDQGVEIEDLGSANGTFVRGNLIRATYLLEHGDEVRFGPCTFNFFFQPAEVSDSTVLMPAVETVSVQNDPVVENVQEMVKARRNKKAKAFRDPGGHAEKSFISKLRQRGVIKVSVAYLVVSWVIMQLVDVTFPLLHLPDWTATLVLVLLVVGFPIALVMAWAYEMTPQGIQREPKDDEIEVPAPRSEAAATEDKISIAVLPFSNLSADPVQEHFCDGLTEELLNVLAGLPGLRVASRTSCFAFKNKSVGLSEVAEKLQVAHVLEGSVRKSGNNIRITAQLIEVANDSHLWSETYDRQLDEIFAIQDDIATRILAALKLELHKGTPEYAVTTNPQAYEHYLRASGYASDKGSKEQELAIKLFQKAVDLDPGFVRAWVKLAQSSALYTMHGEGDEQFLEIANEASEQATQLAPKYAESFLARGYVHLANKQYDNAETEFVKAFKLDPDLESLHGDLQFQEVAETEDVKTPEGDQGFIEAMPLNKNLPPAWVNDGESETMALSLAELEKLGSDHSEGELQKFEQSIDSPTLLILSGNDAGRPYKLQKSGDLSFWTIGNGKKIETISIAIDDSSVSDIHAKLVHKAGRWKIVDQMSTNHTYVNGEQYNSAFLSSSDTIRFGRVNALFLLPLEKHPDQKVSAPKAGIPGRLKSLFKR